jgi:histone deacetylase 6
MSLHRYDHGSFYPNKDFSQASYIGEGEGRGFNCNVAWETGKVVVEEKRKANE